MQKHSTKGIQRGTHCILKRVASFSLGLTLETSEELLGPTVTWMVPYKQISNEQQKSACFMDDSSKVEKQHPIWNNVALRQQVQ